MPPPFFICGWANSVTVASDTQLMWKEFFRSTKAWVCSSWPSRVRGLA
jgi:hypothetical protein